MDGLSIQKQYSSHPLSHSIRAISDTLDALKIKNNVYKFDIKRLNDLPFPFITQLWKGEYPFYIIEKVDSQTNSIIVHNCSGKTSFIEIELFLKVWSGIVLKAENSDSHNNVIKYFINEVIWYVERFKNTIILILICLLMGVIFISNNNYYNIRYLIKGVGAVVSLLILLKMYYNDKIANMCCTSGKRDRCNEVLFSNGANILGFINLGECSLAYFTSSLVYGMIKIEFSSIYLIIDSLSLFAVLYSIIWQSCRRKWCSLCLMLDFILICDFICELILFNRADIIVCINYVALTVYVIIFIIVIFSIQIFIQFHKKDIKYRILKNKREKLLESSDSFQMMLNQQPKASVDSKDYYSICNNNDMDQSITIVINPSCKHCAKTVENMLSIDGYNLNYVFFVNQSDSIAYAAALKLISLSETLNWKEFNCALMEWYNNQIIDFSKKNGEKEINILNKHLDYCKILQLKGTPTVFINNRKLPDIYDIEELKYLL